MLWVLKGLYSEKMLGMLQKDAQSVKKYVRGVKKMLGVFENDVGVVACL